MRRLTLALSAVFVTAAFTSFILLFAVSVARSQAPEGQYATEDSTVFGNTEGQATQKDGVSQGTLGGLTASEAVLQAAREDIAEEERLPDYSQVVGNETKGRFRAVGWQERSGGYSHGGDYAYTESGTEKKSARFKVDIPTAGDYAIYAWWPVAKANSASTRFGVDTASGTTWTKVNQQRDGGMWVKLGTYELEAGTRYAVQVSPEGESGRVVADAVAIVRGAASPPPDDQQVSAGGGQLYSARAGGGRNGWDVVRISRRHLGTPYRHSPPHPCRAHRKEDCSCHTKVVFRRLDKWLPDDPVRQYWRFGGKKVSRSNLRPGDLVAFKEAGRRKPITHVGIYAGNGNLLHASSYFNKVVESKMRYIDGFFGGKRLVRW
jgi:cell wall-associated NlpC family hydrolase